MHHRFFTVLFSLLLLLGGCVRAPGSNNGNNGNDMNNGGDVAPVDMAENDGGDDTADAGPDLTDDMSADVGPDLAPCGGECDPAYCIDEQCVDCISNDDCTDPTASLCEQNECIGCGVSADCAHLMDTTICDVQNGTCEECLDDSEETRMPCEGNSCDPSTNTCTDTAVGALDTCEPCVADSECMMNHLCVPMDFEGAAHGSYCLKVLMDCERPYSTPIQDRQSVGGVVSDFCGIDEAATTCEAVRAFGGECMEVTDCAAQGARCETVGGIANTCTYPCSDSLQCVSGRECVSYCGGT